MKFLRVGNFELCAAERTLTAAGKPLELGARAFDLLLALVEQPGRLVTKAALLERVWPRLVVDENNLPAQIASLRRVLGAGAIRTVQGFGYRLELEVAEVAAATASTATAATNAAPSTVSAPAPAAALAAQPAVSRLAIPRRVWPDRMGPLVGRLDETRDVQQLLLCSNLVTVVGISGVGKTRLAQEIFAREAAAPGSAVAWVPLGPVTDVEHVASAIALALGVSLPDGGDGFAALCDELENAALLLILDSAEHLGDALASPLATLVSRTRALRVLVTSQAPLGITGESVYRLPVLPVPASGVAQTEAATFASVALFAQRAAAADHRFELTAGNIALVAEICRRLDGIPLALELAAARVPALGLAELLARLDDRFRLLKQKGQHSDARHGALHAAFDWSYSLLTADEQRVFNWLGAFAGSFALPCAASVVAGETIDTSEAIDLIGRLVDRSLVTALPIDPPRYILLETARHYAVDKLVANGELDAARARMADAMLTLLDQAFEAYWSVDEAIWLHRYSPEINNVRAAMDWADAHERALSVALFGSAWPLFVEADLSAEGRTRYATVLGALSDTLPRERVGRFWEAIATYDSTRQVDRARFAAELAAAKHAATSDRRANYYALMLLAYNWRVDFAAAQPSYEAARKLEDPAWPARLLTMGALTDGALMTSAGRFDAARDAYLRAIRYALTTSERQALAASVNVVELDIARGDAAAALQLGRPLAASLLHLGRRETRFDLLVLNFSALLLTGALGEARAAGAELYELALRLDTGKLFTALDAMALLTCMDGRYADGAQIAHCADAAHEAHGQARRRPAEERIQTAVVAMLDEQLGAQWRASAPAAQGVARGNFPGQYLDEVMACSLALGRRP